MAPIPHPLLIGAPGLLCGLAALAWAYLLAKRIGRLRYRLSNLERQVGRSEQQGVGLSQELSRLKAELAQFRASQATRSPPALPAVGASTTQAAQVPGAQATATQPAVMPELPPSAPTPEPPTIDALIVAINRGDRAFLSEAGPTELNVTRASEDAIQMGRSEPTTLEEVSGGGSYLKLHLAGVDWLLPTERSLLGFRSHQPAKGLFQFQPGPVTSAEVLQAARIEADGDLWLVVEPGMIRFPG